MSDAIGSSSGLSFQFGQASERATSTLGTAREPITRTLQQASLSSPIQSNSVTLRLSDNALSLLAEKPQSDGVARLLDSLNPNKNRSRDAAINLIGPFFRAAQSGRPLTGDEAAQVGEAFLSLNAAAGFGTDPQSLSQQGRTSLIATLASFDSITAHTGSGQLSAESRQSLDTAINSVGNQLNVQIPADDLAEVIRNNLENSPESDPSLFDFSGTQLAALSGDEVTETVNSVTAINREAGTGADSDSLSNSRQALLESLVSEFDSILQSSGSSLLLGDQLRRLGSITTLISTLLRAGNGTQVFAETTPASNDLSSFEQLLGTRDDTNPLVIGLR